MDEPRQRILILLIAVFAACLAIASVLASKILMIGGLIFPAGVLAYSITFPITDVISELWGKKKADEVVFAGFIALLFIMLLVKFALVVPGAPFWKKDEAFIAILSTNARIVIASFVAYLVSQFHDNWAFHFWRKLTKGKYLWLRNNASTIVSQLLDTVIFITIAFYGIMPGITPVLELIKGQYIVKILIALIDTPVVYILVKLISRTPQS